MMIVIVGDVEMGSDGGGDGRVKREEGPGYLLSRQMAGVIWELFPY